MAKKKGGIYEYLHATGVLNTGNDALIKAAKKEYYKHYKAAWKQAHRKQTKEIVVVFTHSQAQLVASAAKKHNRSQPGFIKAACLAYMNRRYVVPDVLALNTIRELLAMNYGVLKKMLDDNQLTYQSATALMYQVAALENKVLCQLISPVSLEEQIKDAVRQNPAYKDLVLQLLHNE